MAIQEKLMELLSEFENVTKEFKQLTNIIDIAGRERMISQKVMKLFLLQQQNKRIDPRTQREMEDSIQLFDNSLGDLLDSRLNTEEISDQLERVRLLWHHFKSALDARDTEMATDLNNQVLFEMNQAVLLYVQKAGQW